MRPVRRAFTLLELVVVVLVLAVLAAVAVPTFAAVRDEARSRAVLTSAGAVASNVLAIAAAEGLPLPVPTSVMDAALAESGLQGPAAGGDISALRDGEDLVVTLEGSRAVVTPYGAVFLQRLEHGLWWPDGAEPYDIPSDMSAWWDASDPASVVASGGRVSRWSDRSGSGVHLLQDSPSARPYTGVRSQAGGNVLDFRGGQWLSAGDVLDVLDGGLTLVVVYRTDVVANHAVIGKSLYGPPAGRYSLVRAPAMNALFQDTGLRNVVVPDSDTSFRVLAQRIRRSTVEGNELFVSGSRVGATTTSGTVRYDTSFLFGVGAYQNRSGNFSPPQPGLFLDGVVAEALVWNRPLSDAELSSVHGYLAAKWGLPPA